MNGLKNVKNLVEINDAWDEQFGLSVGVAIAEQINPKHISGIKKFDTYRMEILRGHIGMGIIQDRRLSWDCGPKANAWKEKGQYFLYSEIEKLRDFIVIEGMMIPPNFGRFMPDYELLGISCEVCGENRETIAVLNDNKNEDQTIFKSITVKSLFDDLSSTRRILFSCVFGFDRLVKPSIIKIIPKKISRYCIGHDFSLWYINDDVFPRQKKGIKNDGYRKLETEFYLNNLEYKPMDDAFGDELDMPF